MSNRSGFQKAMSGAQIAKDIANIIKGAATGGLHGAAAAAAKSFAPQLIKISLIVTAVLIFIPIIVICALPSVLFGWGSVPDTDLVERKEYAKTMVACYEQVETYRNEVIEEIKSGYEDEYDIVEIVDNGGAPDVYWLISIDGVRASQDVYNINEGEIKRLIRMSLERSVSTEEVEPDESEGSEDGESAETKIIITIDTIQPESLMAKFDYDDEQQNWASLLYNTTTAPQYLGEGDADYLSGSGIDYSGITFGEGSTQVVYFNQLDSRWANTLYGRAGTIGKEGCGPTALAIVVSTLTGTTRNPVEVANWSAANGHRCVGRGSYHSLIPKGAEHYGLKVQGAGKKDGQKLVDALAGGKLIIAIMQKGHFTGSGHFIVLRGVTSEGKILVADPASRNRSEQAWDLSIFLKESHTAAGAGGPFWIISN